MVLGSDAPLQAESPSPKYQATHLRNLSQVPETLIGALTELEQEYTKAMKDPDFKVRLALTKLAKLLPISAPACLKGCPFAG